MTATAAIKDGQKPSGSRRKRRSALHRIIPLMLVIAGIAVLLYPVTATYLRNSHQSSVAEAYRDAQTHLSQSDREMWLERAREYNRQNAASPILDPWLNRVSRDNAPYADYLAELNPSGEEDTPMAALSIPAIDSQLPVYHGTEPDTLHNGVGHLYGSALPVGGEGNHSVLTGHTGLTTATLFDRLNEVKQGDVFYLDVLGEAFKYEVDQIKVVLPEEVTDVQPSADEDLVTLVTCTPYGVNSHRLLVRGTRVPMDENEVDEAFDRPANIWQPWMIAVVGLVAVVILVIVFLVLRARKRRRTTAPEKSGEHGEG